MERTGEGGRTQSPGPGLGQDRQKRAWVVTGRLADWGAGREIQKVWHLLHLPNKCHQLKEGAEEFGGEIRRHEMILRDSDTVNSLSEGAG